MWLIGCLSLWKGRWQRESLCLAFTIEWVKGSLLDQKRSGRQWLWSMYGSTSCIYYRNYIILFTIVIIKAVIFMTSVYLHVHILVIDYLVSNTAVYLFDYRGDEAVISTFSLFYKDNKEMRSRGTKEMTLFFLFLLPGRQTR